jgi:hypothetical protein
MMKNALTPKPNEKIRVLSQPEVDLLTNKYPELKAPLHRNRTGPLSGLIYRLDELKENRNPPRETAPSRGNPVTDFRPTYSENPVRAAPEEEEEERDPQDDQPYNDDDYPPQNDNDEDENNPDDNNENENPDDQDPENEDENDDPDRDGDQ